ncbi:RsmD family RNA methyltransferase [Synoicihabitans lomoniglobus]|uniref:RsmD family RNA methyltransferase n=1 Tax=Synoicihabitans lomoniglobus TaxID=2909285 RepID=A0AAE9ZW03_9BACT|nr:RsmD family RNA methyltransferase [Opitutaceae bacterium LMO-M01]WED63895.1 RsmD family RNA methyltransferase [Opitutaceae bacterium LMO-M01]
MRISGGAARGITLQVPKGDAVRPATDGMRQAIFSSLGPRVVGARFLDLFAGSGAYGLEALSRGAAGGVWVEQHARTVGLLRRNITAVCRSLGRDETDLQVVAGDAVKVPWPVAEARPDLVFIDPPYPIIAEVAPAIFARLSELLGQNADALVLFELPGGLELNPAGWACVRRIGKGVRQPTVAVFRREGGPR